MAQGQIKPIIINTDGVISTIHSIQNECLNDSLFLFHLLIENKSKYTICIPRMSRCIGIENKLIINCGYINHSFSMGTMFMTLDCIKIGESFEKTIIGKNINYSNISEILISVDFLVSNKKRKLKERINMDIYSVEYEKKAIHISLRIPAGSL